MTAHEILVAYFTLVRKELTRMFRIWPQTLVPPAVTMSLYFLIFGKLVGSQLHPVSGVSYMQYIVPGLLMMSIIMNSYVNSSSSFFGMKFQRSIEEMLISPMPNAAILWGFVTGALLRAVIVATLVFVIARGFTHITLLHGFAALLLVIMTASFFAIAGLVNAIFARNFDDISWVPSFVLTPFTYLGGVFFSIHMLSGLWQTVAAFNPIFYLIDAFRYTLLGVHDTSIALSVSILLGMTLALYLYALFLLKTSTRLRA